MNCPKCNVAIPENSQFCPQCGLNLADKTAAEQFKQNLTPRAAASEPEKEIWQGSYSPKALYGTWLLCAVVTVAAISVGLVFITSSTLWIVLAAALTGIWLYAIGMLVYQRMSVHYRLTTQRFFHERGILRRATNRIEVIDMDDIGFEQGLIERFLGVGTIRITSSDRTDPNLALRGIDDVAKVAALIDDVRRQERLKRGVFVESV